MYESQPSPENDPEEIKNSWTIWLDNFRRDIYPIFQERGFTFPAAVTLYRTNLLYNRLDKLIVIDEEDPEDDESEKWKR